MGAFLIIGLLGFIACLVLLIVNLITKKPLKKVSIALALSFFLFVFGVIATPSPETTLPEQQASVELEAGEPEPDVAEIDSVEPEDSTGEIGGDEPPAAATAPAGEMKVHFIDVGQGDSILIQTPTLNILIDGGDRGNTALSYLRSQGVTSLDLIIGTHPHADHIGGLINVLQSMPVKEVMDPAVVHTTKTFEDYLTIIDEKDIKFTEGRAGMTRDLGGGAIMQVLHPSSPSSSDLNNASLVVKITFGQISFMLTGDAETAAENQIRNRGYDLRSTILKIGHHGSKSSTTQAFLSAVAPKAAVILCGAGNNYGHPHDEILQRLVTAGIDIYRTDIHGTIIITTDGQTYSVNKQPFAYAQQQQPPPQSAATTPTGKFVGSKKSDKYHYPSCTHAKKILPENEVWFDSVSAAKAAGYVPCGGCKPPSN